MARGEPVRLLAASLGRESTAILIPLQVILFLLITAFLVRWFAQMHRRNSCTWETMLARMSPECRLEWRRDRTARAEALGVIWMKSPRRAFRDSGVLLEMADYAERNAVACDAARLQAVRGAALQLRMAATRAMMRRTSPD